MNSVIKELILSDLFFQMHHNSQYIYNNIKQWRGRRKIKVSFWFWRLLWISGPPWSKDCFTFGHFSDHVPSISYREVDDILDLCFGWLLSFSSKLAKRNASLQNFSLFFEALASSQVYFMFVVVWLQEQSVKSSTRRAYSTASPQKKKSQMLTCQWTFLSFNSGMHCLC